MPAATDLVADLQQRLGGAPPEEVLSVALHEIFPERIAAVSSFGAESAVLLHLVAAINPATPVVFVDTGRHFRETLDYRDRLVAHLGLTDVRTIGPSAEEVARLDPDSNRAAWDPDGCCNFRKVAPLERALGQFDAWITGRKRFQAITRIDMPMFEADGAYVKINPLANWNTADIAAYVATHRLPSHPLVAQGYRSIGCAPCTSMVALGEDQRAGRWRGLEKTECGIHRPAANPSARVESFMCPPADASKIEIERSAPNTTSTLSPHLQRLEDEAVFILREVVAEFRKPVMLYSVGKDSSVMLHLARKAFYPARPPFPFLHIASGWDFQAVLEHRDRVAAAYGLELLVHGNKRVAHGGVNPFDTEAGEYSRLMLTEPLKDALDCHGFDAAFGGGRRDEEKARAKERIFSYRAAGHVWDPRNQRPELWRLFNTRLSPGDTMRVFPLSNWTELDVWTYIQAESIPIVPLYFAGKRCVVVRDGALIAVEDGRMRLLPNESVETRQVRFRTLGCWPLTGAVESMASDVGGVIAELLEARSSERQGRLVDGALQASMERKKREGYF